MRGVPVIEGAMSVVEAAVDDSLVRIRPGTSIGILFDPRYDRKRM